MKKLVFISAISAICIGSNASAEDVSSETIAEDYEALRHLAAYCAKEPICQDTVKIVEVQYGEQTYEGIEVNAPGDSRTYFQPETLLQIGGGWSCYRNNFVGTGGSAFTCIAF